MDALAVRGGWGSMGTTSGAFRGNGHNWQELKITHEAAAWSILKRGGNMETQCFLPQRTPRQMPSNARDFVRACGYVCVHGGRGFGRARKTHPDRLGPAPGEAACRP